MGVSRIRQFPLAALPLRIPAVMRKEYEVEVSSEYGAAGIVPPRTRKSGQRVKLFRVSKLTCGVGTRQAFKRVCM